VHQGSPFARATYRFNCAFSLAHLILNSSSRFPVCESTTDGSTVVISLPNVFAPRHFARCECAPALSISVDPASVHACILGLDGAPARPPPAAGNAYTLERNASGDTDGISGESLSIDHNLDSTRLPAGPDTQVSYTASFTVANAGAFLLRHPPLCRLCAGLPPNESCSAPVALAWPRRTNEGRTYAMVPGTQIGPINGSVVAPLLRTGAEGMAQDSSESSFVIRAGLCPLSERHPERLVACHFQSDQHLLFGHAHEVDFVILSKQHVVFGARGRKAFVRWMTTS